MKRKEGMSREAFWAYYETKHVPLWLEYTAGIVRYVRRYIQGRDHPETGSGENLEYDVITELWFEDEKLYHQTLAYLSTNTMPEQVTEDEKNLFDRTSFRIATCDEVATEFP